MSDKIGKYYWVKTKAGKEIAFKRDSGLWEMHGIDCIEDCNELILEVYGEVANGATTGDSGLHLQRVSGSYMLKGNLEAALATAIKARREQERELDYWIDSALVGGWVEVLKRLESGEEVYIK